MLYEGIDHVTLTTPSIDAAAAPFERLGLKVSPLLRHPDTGFSFRFIAVGGAQNMFEIVFAEAGEADAAPSFRLGLRVDSLATSLVELATHGAVAESREILGSDGAKLADIALLPTNAAACADIAFIEYVLSQPDRYAETERQGLLAHSLELKRLDHMAAVAPDLELTTAYWNDSLGIPTWGEVVTPTTVIRQMRTGDAILELLGPAGPDSPFRSRAPGLTGTVAFEVPDLDAAVTTGRDAGFTVSDPATGSLPGTRVARFAATELSGLNLQLLQYV